MERVAGVDEVKGEGSITAVVDEVEAGAVASSGVLVAAVPAVLSHHTRSRTGFAQHTHLMEPRHAHVSRSRTVRQARIPPLHRVLLLCDSRLTTATVLPPQLMHCPRDQSTLYLGTTPLRQVLSLGVVHPEGLSGTRFRC